MQQPNVSRPRHVRLLCYAIVAFIATVIASAIFSFTMAQALAYSVAVYVVLNAVNFSKVLGKCGPA